MGTELLHLLVQPGSSGKRQGCQERTCYSNQIYRWVWTCSIQRNTRSQEESVSQLDLYLCFLHGELLTLHETKVLQTLSIHFFKLMSHGLQALPATILQPNASMQKGLVESKATATEGGVFGSGYTMFECWELVRCMMGLINMNPKSNTSSKIIISVSLFICKIYICDPARSPMRYRSRRSC